MPGPFDCKSPIVPLSIRLRDHAVIEHEVPTSRPCKEALRPPNSNTAQNLSFNIFRNILWILSAQACSSGRPLLSHPVLPFRNPCHMVPAPLGSRQSSRDILRPLNLLSHTTTTRKLGETPLPGLRCLLRRSTLLLDLPFRNLAFLTTLPRLVNVGESQSLALQTIKAQAIQVLLTCGVGPARGLSRHPGGHLLQRHNKHLLLQFHRSHLLIRKAIQLSSMYTRQGRSLTAPSGPPLLARLNITPQSIIRLCQRSILGEGSPIAHPLAPPHLVSLPFDRPRLYHSPFP